MKNQIELKTSEEIEIKIHGSIFKIRGTGNEFIGGSLQITGNNEYSDLCVGDINHLIRFNDVCLYYFDPKWKDNNIFNNNLRQQTKIENFYTFNQEKTEVLINMESINPDKVNIKTGVLNGNNLESWDNDFIDLQYESALQEYLENNSDDPDGDNFEFDETGTDQLYGDWLKDNEGKYYPDPSGEYAFIYDSNHNTIQVVFSKYCMFVARCSPCYPNQGDLDSIPNHNSMGDPVYAYCLPVSMMDNQWIENKQIFKIQEETQ